MSVRSEESSDDTMGDGGYEVLTDSTLMTDEEDDGASSVASFDDDDDGFVASDAGHGVVDDKASSVASTADSTTASSVGTSAASLATDSSAPIPSYAGLDQQHIAGSRATVRGAVAVRARDGASDEIVFFEPHDDDQGHGSVSVRHRLSPFSFMETADFLRRLPPHDEDDGDQHVPALFRAVHMSMSIGLLEMEEPFRLLYVGPTAAKDDIQHKLAAALAVPIAESTSSTRSWDSLKSPRFNIIPIASFGARSISPDVELVDSSGLDMVVDVCTAARAASKPDDNDDDDDDDRSELLSLRLNGNQNIVSYSRPGAARFQLDCPPGWKLPHLAAFYCADDDTSQRRLTRLHARAFMERHRVPVLVISQNPQYHLDAAPPPDPRSVHLSIESQSAADAVVIHKTLPVDLSTFLMLNPRQLNRNLGCITGLAARSTPPPCAKSSAATATATASAAATTAAATTAAAATASSIATAAAVATTATATATASTAPVESDPLLRDLEEAVRDRGHYRTREKRREELWRLIFFGWFFAAALAGAVLGLAYVQFLEVHYGPHNSAATLEAVVAPASLAPAWSKLQSLPPSTASVARLGSATSTALSPSPSPSSSSSSSSPSLPSLSSPSSPSPSPSSPSSAVVGSLVDFKPRVAEPSDQFEASTTIIGSEHVVVLRPPHRMLLLRRPPPLQVSLTRGGDSVDARLSPLVNGIYTLAVGDEDAWGVMTVSVRTKHRPVIKSLLEIDFGNPWLRRRVQWRKKTDQAAAEARLLASRFSRSAGDHVAELGAAALDKAREYSGGVSSGLRKLCRDRRGRLSVSTEQRAEYVRKAQQQALAIWTRGKQALRKRH